VPGAARFGGLEILATAEPLAKGWVSVEADAQAVGDCLEVRSRQDGDRFQPLGMAGSKKLQDFFVDARLPRRQRDAVPLFVNQRGIVWVGGLRLAEWARPRPGQPAVFLAYRP
jgi:tRNA(Ile)-lysidine synthase